MPRFYLYYPYILKQQHKFEAVACYGTTVEVGNKMSEESKLYTHLIFIGHSINYKLPGMSTFPPFPALFKGLISRVRLWKYMIMTRVAQQFECQLGVHLL